MFDLYLKRKIKQIVYILMFKRKYLSWLYDIGIVAKLNTWRTKMRILPSYHNFIPATIEV